MRDPKTLPARRLHRLILALALALSPLPAAALGTLVGPDGAVPLETSRSLLIRSADRVQLITQIKYTGAPADLVWLIAVPNVPNAIDAGVRVGPASQAILDALDDRSHPLLEGACDGSPTGERAEARQAPSWGPSVDLTGRVFEALALENGDLNSYLTQTRGYTLDAATEAALADTLDQNFMFVAVHLDAAVTGQARLDPVISVTWPEAPGPTRIGTRPLAAAIGENIADLVVWILDAERARANLTTRELDLSAVRFEGSGTNYLAAFDAQIAPQQTQVFITEHAEPLAAGSFDQPDLEALRSASGAAFLTRLRARMRAAVFRTNAKVVSFTAMGAAAYDRTHTVEGLDCGGADPEMGVPAEDQGVDAGADAGPISADQGPGPGPDQGASGGGGGGGGCAARPGRGAPWPLALALLLPLGLLARRRR